ncbi:acetylxylan esterase [Termitidicoccus mucosus]|uniref:acetylxylan esterase n=1 Tax=Termitidicoccus mucosus TaxID=1184151 RepID=UPI002FEE00D6
MQRTLHITYIMLMSMTRWFCHLTGLFIFAVGVFAEETLPGISVTTDRPDALYHVGETVRFRIQIRQPAPRPEGIPKIHWRISRDGASPEKSGIACLDGDFLELSATSDTPGFVRCDAMVTFFADTPAEKNKTSMASAAAGFDPAKITPSMSVPDDFDAFWNEKKAALLKIPVKASLTPVTIDGASDIEAFDVQVPCVGAPVSGYFVRPAVASPRGLPAILIVHGAGVRSSDLDSAVKWARRGLLALNINAHGLPNGRPDSFYADKARDELANYRTRGCQDRESMYFLGMFLRVLRALDFLAMQPEWDGRRLLVVGGSQGGAQAVVAAGLDKRVSFISAAVPALADCTGVLAGKPKSWPYFIASEEIDTPEMQSTIQAVRYYDIMNFATRAKAKAVFSVGFIDETCPPSCVYAVFNNYAGEKQMFNDVRSGHKSSPDSVKFRESVLDEYINGSR